MLSVNIGLLLCSCTSSSDEESRKILVTRGQPPLQEYMILDEEEFKNQRVNEILANQKALLDENYQRILQEQKNQRQKNYANKPCHDQSDCGGVNSGYFCNYAGTQTTNVCEKTTPQTMTIGGQNFYYNSWANLKSWCREARLGAPEDKPGNCNWGYLSYKSAQAWCESIGKHLLDAKEIEQNCTQFSFLPKFKKIQQYWTQDLTVVHIGKECSIQKMVRGDGYSNAGGVICK